MTDVRAGGEDTEGAGERWTEAEGREVLREWRESGLSAVEFSAQRGFSAARLSYWEERLDKKPSGTVSFVAVPLSSQYAVEVVHRGVSVRLAALSMDELARRSLAEPADADVAAESKIPHIDHEAPTLDARQKGRWRQRHRREKSPLYSRIKQELASL